MPLPPRSPELSPVENIRQYIREDWLSKGAFGSCDDIVTLSCEAWNRLIDRPWKIMTIGLRGRAHGSRSVQVGMKHLAGVAPDLDGPAVPVLALQTRLSRDGNPSGPHHGLGDRHSRIALL